MTAIQIKIVRLPHARGLPLPEIKSLGAAGADLAAAVSSDRPLVIKPGERALVPTGLCMALPDGHEAQIRPRSGLALKHGVTTLNAPGTIDADYRGEVHVLLINLGENDFHVERGMRVAQMVVAPFCRPGFVQVEELDASERGEKGFGSTGHG